MLKYIWMTIGFICFAAIAYVLHVPLLKYWTAPAQGSELAEYASLSDGIVGQTYKIEQIVDGKTLEIYYDPKNKIYVIAAEFFNYDREEYFGRHIIILEGNGDLRDIRRIDQEHLEILRNASTLEQVRRIGEREYSSNYSFSDSNGAIELVHYQFRDFVNWPYMYYFIPVIPSEWYGTAYILISHLGDEFRLKIPTNFSGGFLYSRRNIDGQIYLRQRPNGAGGLTFLQVDESSYTRDMNGNETHREGYGLYLFRPK